MKTYILYVITTLASSFWLFSGYTCTPAYFHAQALFQYPLVFCEDHLVSLMAFEDGEYEIAIQELQGKPSDFQTSILELTFRQDRLPPTQFYSHLKQLWRTALQGEKKTPWVPLLRLSKQYMTPELWTWLQQTLHHSNLTPNLLQAESDLVSMGYFNVLSQLKSGHPMIKAYQKDLTSFETVINKLPLSFFDPFGHLAILEHYKNKGDLELAQSWFRVCEEAVNVHFSQAYLKQLDRLHQKTNFLSKQWKLQQLKLELDRQWDWLYTAQNKNILSLKSQAGLYTLAGLAALLFLSFLVYFFQKQAFQKKLHVAQLAKTERDGALHIEKENQEALEFTQNLSQKTILPFIQRASNKLFEDFEPHKHEQLLGIKAAIDSEIQALNNALSTAGISDKKRWDIFQTEFPTNPALHFQDVSNCNWPSHTSGLLKELSTNSLKHANCSRIDIQLMQLEKDFIISYQDNGKGLDPNNSKGIGLTNMHQTVSNIGGKIELHWKGGFNAKIHIPL